MMKIKTKGHYWLKSGIFTLLQNLSLVLFGFGSFFILVRVLDKSSFGAWALFMSTTAIMEVIRNGLIQNGLIKFLSAAEEGDKPKIIGASFTISGILTLACILFLFLFGGLLSRVWETPQLAEMFYTYSIVFLVIGLMTQLQFIEQANFRFAGIFFSVFVRQGTLFAFILANYILQREISLISLVYVQILGAVLSTFIIWLFARKNFAISFNLQMEWIKKLFNYGKFAFGTSVSSMVFNSMDQMMLGGMLSTAAAGAYNIAIRITKLVEIPTASVASIVFPQSAKRVNTEGKSAAKHLYEKSVGAILALLIPGLLFMFFFTEFVVYVVAGESYPETVPVLQVTILYCLLIPFGRQFGTILDSMGKPKLTFKIVMLSAGINLLLNYILISRFGVMGAAYGTLLSNMIGFAISQAILRRELSVSIKNTLVHTKNFYFELFNKYLRPGFAPNKVPD